MGFHGFCVDVLYLQLRQFRLAGSLQKQGKCGHET
jgi:hypothetical protein